MNNKPPMRRNVPKDAVIFLIINAHPEINVTEIDLFSDMYIQRIAQIMVDTILVLLECSPDFMHLRFHKTFLQFVILHSNMAQ